MRDEPKSGRILKTNLHSNTWDVYKPGAGFSKSNLGDKDIIQDDNTVVSTNCLKYFLLK